MYYDINNLSDLVRAARDIKTGGYEVTFEIKPNLDRARSGDGFFLIIETSSDEPNVTGFNGEWWFDDDDLVMQVL